MTNSLQVRGWSRWWSGLALLLAMAAGNAWAAVQVWVQPSGDTFANAYALVSEARTYFGRAEGGGGSYQYKWDFSDGTGTAWAAVGNARYIDYAGKAFGTAGTHWARLSVRDANNTADVGAAQIDLQVAAVDDLGRQKNSAIDRGLRWMYQQENVNGNQSSWNGNVGYTGMALIAFENQGHNLESPDSDIYKKSVQRGIQYLLENASLQNVNDQRCIGNPEAASSGDTMIDGKGVLFGGDDLYHNSISVLALLNSAKKPFAQATVASTSSTVNGLTLYQIGIQAKDWLAWAQGEGSSDVVSLSCSSPGWPGGVFGGTLSGLAVTGLSGYAFNSGSPMPGGSLGTINIDWGDGTTAVWTDVDECGWASYYNQPSMGYCHGGTPTHTYGSAGNYNMSFTFTGADGTTTTSLCGWVVNATGGTTTCGAGDAANGAGGWRYNSNYSSSDNSVTQWPVLALEEALVRWDINTSQPVKDMLGLWLGFSQCSNGTFGYASGDSSGWCNFPKGAGGLISLKYAGKALGDAAVQNDLAFLNNNWNTSGYDYNFNNHYSQYAFYKGMKLWGLTTLGTHNWQREYDQDLITRQNGDGSWYESGGWMDQSMASFAAVAILAPDVASLPPVANAGGPYPSINANQSLALNGGNSFHKDPTKHIVLYQWDFDASDGLWWASKAAPAANEGALGVTPNLPGYPDTGANKDYTVTLRVVDDTSPTPMTATDSAVIHVTTGNAPPVPLANGPWTALPNQDIFFDGSASYDPNDAAHCSGSSCLGDHIVKYEWDLNGDGIFDGPEDGTAVTADRKIVKRSFPAPISLPARLRVTDSFGLQATTPASNINVVSVALVYGQSYQSCYRVAIDRFRARLGLSIVFKNQGNAEAENVVMTLTSVPTNFTMTKGVANLGNMAAGQSKTTACDPNAKTADIEVIADTRVPATGSWLWKADFELLGQHYTVNNIPPIGP